MSQRGLRVLITLGAVAIVLLRLLWPTLKIDAVTLGLVVVAVLPWLSGLIRSAEFPGGWKIEFQDVQAAGEKVTATNPTTLPSTEGPPPSYLQIAERDPNLALVGLRIEIEKRLRQLATHHKLPQSHSMIRLFEELRRRGILNDPSVSGLSELVMAGNQAAHGARVEAQAASWAIDYGPQVLAVLDAKLGESERNEA